MQLSLPRPLIHLDETIISRPSNMLKAFTMAADMGGLDDKQAAAAAGLDVSTWSQFKQGKRGIKPLDLDIFMDECGNELPLAHWAYRRGYELVHLETSLEKQLRAQRERAELAEAENAMLKKLFIGRAE